MSRGGKEVGELSVKTGSVTAHFEWTIQDVLSHAVEDEYYDSPTVSIPGSRWHLRVYMDRRSVDGSFGFVSLYLQRMEDSTYPKSVVFSLGVKKADGTVEERVVDFNHVFPSSGQGRGSAKFLSRSELESRKSELLPSDALTVTCTLRADDRLDATSALMKLSRDLKDAYISQRSSDVTLRVKNKDLSVHRAVLACRSPVFRSMFEVDMKEKSTGVVEIVDCSPEVFQDFLVYLYSGEFENRSRRVFDLYRVADKYAVEELKSECVRSMLSNLTINSVVGVIRLAHQFNEHELELKSEEFFQENFCEIVDTPQWNSFLDTDRNLANELTKSACKRARR